MCVIPGLCKHAAVTCNLMLQKNLPMSAKTFTTHRLRAIDVNLFDQDIIQSLSSIDFVNDNVDPYVSKYNDMLNKFLVSMPQSKNGML